jgi:hypothetical protein
MSALEHDKKYLEKFPKDEVVLAKMNEIENAN